MKLLSLSLREFRLFERCDLEFPDGIIGVRGPNGSGKTTIAEAIGWALFGKLRPGSKVADARRQHAAGPSSVELTFRLGPTIYRVERVVGGRASLWIGESATPETTQTRATTIAIARELGIGWDVFQRTVFARQKDVAALDPTVSSSVRAAHVERLLGLSRYRDAANASKERSKALADQLIGIREQAPDLGELKVRLAEALATAAAGSPVVQAAQQRVELSSSAARAAQEGLEAEQARAGQAVRMADQLAAARKALDETLSDLAACQARAERRRVDETRLAQIEAALPDLAAARAFLARWEALAVCHAELDRLGTPAGELAELRSEQESLIAAPVPDPGALLRRATALERCAALPAVEEADRVEQALAHDREAAIVRRSRVGDRLEDDEAHLAALEANGADQPCPVCLRPYGSDYESIRAAHVTRIESAREELASLEGLCGELDVKYREAAGVADESRAAAAGLAQTSGPDDAASARAAHETAASASQARAARLAALGAQIPALERFATAAAALAVSAFEPDALAAAREQAGDAEALHGERGSLRARIEATQDVDAKLAELEDRRDGRTAEIGQVSEHLEALALVPGQLERLRAQRDDASAELLVAQEELHEAKLRAQGSDQIVGELRGTLARAEEIHARIAERERELREQQAATGLLTDFRASQSARAWPNLEQGASVLLSDTTDGRYADVRLSKDYKLQVVDRGELFGLDRYSGGEQDLANLCLRLAIADWVARERDTELGFVVLDEVFGSQDEDRRQRLVEALRSLANRFSQLLVITHVPEIADLCDYQLVSTLVEPGLSRAALST